MVQTVASPQRCCYSNPVKIQLILLLYTCVFIWFFYKARWKGHGRTHSQRASVCKLDQKSISKHVYTVYPQKELDILLLHTSDTEHKEYLIAISIHIHPLPQIPQRISGWICHINRKKPLAFFINVSFNLQLQVLIYLFWFWLGNSMLPWIQWLVSKNTHSVRTQEHTSLWQYIYTGKTLSIGAFFFFFSCFQSLIFFFLLLK